MARENDLMLNSLVPYLEFAERVKILKDELIAFVADLNKKNKRIDRAKESLNLVGLGDRMNHKPSELSGGQQQRVAVARALINNPSVVFADEPSGNLDTNAAKSLHDLFFKLRNEFEQTFVIVTHNRELAKMSDRMLEMKDGVLI